MKLIVGLGNPGPRYKNTWHNIGFLAIDQFQAQNEFEDFKNQAKFHASISIGKLGRKKIILAKPETFMNESGAAVLALMQFYKITIEDLIIIHDDVDLSWGKIRLAQNSSAGGHNGIKSIISRLGTQEFIRIKVGVSTDRKKIVGTTDYVLEKIPAEHKKEITKIIEKTADAISTVVKESLERAMNLYN